LLITGVFYVAVVIFLPYGVVWTVSLQGGKVVGRLKRALKGRR